MNNVPRYYSLIFFRFWLAQIPRQILQNELAKFKRRFGTSNKITTIDPKNRLSPEGSQFNGFRNQIMWWRGRYINFRISREYQTFRLIKNFGPPVEKLAIARKQTSQCNVRRLLARRVLVSLLQDLAVFLDQCLSFDEHIRKTVASCMNKPIQINRI